MKKKTKNTLITILVFVLVFTLALAFFVRLGNDETENTTFSVEYDGKTYSGEDNEIWLPESGKAEFKVSNTTTYSVKVLPNEDLKDLIFNINGGGWKSFIDYNYTSAFDITETDKGFAINCDKEYSIQSVLQRYFNTSEIEIYGPYSSDWKYFTLIIESNSGDVIKLDFRQFLLQEFEIKFDKGGIVF